MKKLYLDSKLFNGSEEEFLAVEKFSYKEWRFNGKLHRADGPAVIRSNEYQEWWQNGKLHRTDGPAQFSSRGPKYWWVEGVEFKYFFSRFFPICIFPLKSLPGA